METLNRALGDIRTTTSLVKKKPSVIFRCGMIERSETSVSIDMLADIAEVLGVSLRDLVDPDWTGEEHGSAN